MGGAQSTYIHKYVFSCILWPEIEEKMRSMLERALGSVEHNMMDWEGRSMGNVGFVWALYIVTLDRKVKISRYHEVTTLLR